MSSVSVSQLKFCLFKRREKLIRILFTCGKYVVILSLSRCGGMTKRRMTFQTRRKLRFKKAVDRTKNMKALFFPPPLSLHDCNTQEKLKQWLCHFFFYFGGRGGGGKVHHGLHVYVKMVIDPVQNCVKRNRRSARLLLNLSCRYKNWCTRP